jgi:hypothetical protein
MPSVEETIKFIFDAYDSGNCVKGVSVFPCEKALGDDYADCDKCVMPAILAAFEEAGYVQLAEIRKMEG